MKRTILLVASAIGAAIAATMLPAPGAAQGLPQPPPYNPYPPGILPSDIDAEQTRVFNEVQGIHQKYLQQWHALPPITFTGNPPTIQGNGYDAQRILGGLLNYDTNMSPFKNFACASCHMPYTAFSGPIPSVNLTMIAYPGSYHYRAAKRTAQRYPYAYTFPVLNYDPASGAFIGGNFWDGRATGYILQSADAEQAQHPPVDPLEMMLPDTACIAFRLQTAVYRPLFEAIYGADSLLINFPPNTEQICDTPGDAAVFNGSATPIPLSPDDRTKATDVYNHWGQAISFLEKSADVSPFTSKIDAFLNGKYTYTADEAAGAALFDGKGNCNSCHLDGKSTTLTSGQTDTGTPASVAPLFTCFGYANLGLPLNPRIALFYASIGDSFGFTPNPDGFAYRDLGLGNFLRSGPQSAPNPNSQWVQFAPTSDGQMQTMTIRNVGMAPQQCPTTEAPGPYFQKELFHNGYIKSLKQLVHFYNTRDVYPFKVLSGNCPAGTTEKVDCWPEPEVPNNIDMTVGNLGLTDAEENQVVAFLQAATDGFLAPYPFRDTFTGQCKTGGSASTQGNETLISTPPLPSCAADICGVQPFPAPLPIP
jgi:cytochrome c peroxidase